MEETQDMLKRYT